MSDSELDQYEPVLTHGDLWYDHLLVDGRGSSWTGVVDFGNVHVGDPAHGDFCILRHLGSAFFTVSVLKEYCKPFQPPSVLLRRIDRYWQLRELWGVEYSERYKDRVEIEDSIRKLRAGAILKPSEHPSLVCAISGSEADIL